MLGHAGASVSFVVTSVARSHDGGYGTMLKRAMAKRAKPFGPLVPNDETTKAMKAARRGDLVTVGSVDDLLADLHCP